MAAYHAETVVGADGSLWLKNVPNLAGHRVEVIVRDRAAAGPAENLYPLRGSVKKYDAPFESVASDDWKLSE